MKKYRFKSEAIKAVWTMATKQIWEHQWKETSVLYGVL